VDSTTAPARPAPFQLFRNLAPPIEAALRASIYRFGVLVPVAKDQHGNILDGHQRARIADELGVKYPVNIIEVADDAEALEIARTLNEDRRAMPKAERLEVVKALREEGVTLSDIAEVVGTDVATVHRDLSTIADAKVPERAVGKDGKWRPTTYQRKEPKPPAADALRFAKEVKREQRQERDQQRIEQRAQVLAKEHPLDGERYNVFVHDITTGPPEGEWAPAAVITDPPYPYEFYPLYRYLWVAASEILPEGGSLLAMCGQSHLDDIVPLVGGYKEQDGYGWLTYQWTLNYYTPGQSTQVFGRRVKSNWKPVLWYVNGTYTGEHVDDTIRSGENDKRFHDWGQSVSGMAALIERFTVPGDLIYDPFCGGGTTGVAALLTGRLFVGSDIDEACVKQTAARLAEVAG